MPRSLALRSLPLSLSLSLSLSPSPSLSQSARLPPIASRSIRTAATLQLDEHESLQSVSENAKACLKSLLAPTAALRPSAKEALRTPWLKSRNAGPDAPPLKASIPAEMQKLCDQADHGQGYGSPSNSEFSQRSVDTPSSSEEEEEAAEVTPSAGGPANLAARMLRRVVSGGVAIPRPSWSKARSLNANGEAPAAAAPGAEAGAIITKAPAEEAAEIAEPAAAAAAEPADAEAAVETRDRGPSVQLLWLQKMEETPGSAEEDSPPPKARHSRPSGAAGGAAGGAAASKEDFGGAPGEAPPHPVQASAALLQLHEILGGEAGCVVAKRAKRMGRALAMYQPRRLWISIDDAALCYARSPHTRPTRGRRAGQRAVSQDSAPNGRSPTRLKGVMGRSPLAQPNGGAGLGAAPMETVPDVESEARRVEAPAAATHDVVGEMALGALPLPRLCKRIPLSDVLSVRLTEAATLVLQCRKRVYTFRFPKSQRAVATQLAAVLQPTLLFETDGLDVSADDGALTPAPTPHRQPPTTTTPKAADATAAAAAAAARLDALVGRMPPSPSLSLGHLQQREHDLVSANEQTDAAAKLAAGAKASLSLASPAWSATSGETDPDVLRLAEEANAAVAAAMEAAAAARKLAERATAKVHEAHERAACYGSSPGSSASLPDSSASFGTGGSASHAALPTAFLGAASTPPRADKAAAAAKAEGSVSEGSEGAPAEASVSRGIRKARPFWEIQQERAEKKRQQEAAKKEQQQEAEARAAAERAPPPQPPQPQPPTEPAASEPSPEQTPAAESAALAPSTELAGEPAPALAPSAELAGEPAPALAPSAELAGEPAPAPAPPPRSKQPSKDEQAEARERAPSVEDDQEDMLSAVENLLKKARGAQMAAATGRYSQVVIDAAAEEVPPPPPPRLSVALLDAKPAARRSQPSSPKPDTEPASLDGASDPLPRLMTRATNRGSFDRSTDRLPPPPAAWEPSGKAQPVAATPAAAASAASAAAAIHKADMALLKADRQTARAVSKVAPVAVSAAYKAVPVAVAAASQPLPDSAEQWRASVVLDHPPRAVSPRRGRGESADSSSSSPRESSVSRYSLSPRGSASNSLAADELRPRVGSAGSASSPREMTIDWQRARGDTTRQKSVRDMVRVLSTDVLSSGGPCSAAGASAGAAGGSAPGFEVQGRSSDAPFFSARSASSSMDTGGTAPPPSDEHRPTPPERACRASRTSLFNPTRASAPAIANDAATPDPSTGVTTSNSPTLSMLRQRASHAFPSGTGSSLNPSLGEAWEPVE